MHRVQRVPVTESQGRVHTSAAGVLVMPEAEQVDVEIDDNDLRIDVYRSSGPGGQSVNTTDSAVRITHLPTGIVASCQNEKSQLQNKESAMRILRARLLAAAQEAADAEASEARRSQVRTVDRSERIRTYNYPENRISDHRTGYKSYNLDQVLDGDLQPVLDSCVEADLAARLEALGASDARPARVRARPPRGCARPASPAPSTTPTSCSPTCSDAPLGRLPLRRRRRPAAERERYDALVAPPRGPRAAAAPDRHRRASATSSSPSGPGVFVPRPETELLAGWAIERGAARARPRAGRRRPLHRLRRDRPGASPTRCRTPTCTRSSSTRRALRLGRAQPRRHRRRPAPRRLRHRLRRPAGTVDVVVCNPPYIPLEAWESVAPEARDHDPHLALFSGDDGLDAIRVLERRGRRCCCGPGEWSASSTPTSRASPRPAVFAADRRWAEVRDHRDLAGRPRFTTGATGTMSRVRQRFATDDRRRSARRRSRPPSLAVQRGELVVLPTDTVYGIGRRRVRPGRRAARCWTPRAAAARCRRRCWSAPPPRSTRSPIEGARPRRATLVEAFWPGPLTLVCHQQTSLQWDLGETRGTVAVRMPDHEVALAVLERTGPLAVSSANLTGRPAATDADQAEEMLGDDVDGDRRRRRVAGRRGLHDRRRHRPAGPGAAPRRAVARAAQRGRSRRSAVDCSTDEG